MRAEAWWYARGYLVGAGSALAMVLVALAALRLDRSARWWKAGIEAEHGPAVRSHRAPWWMRLRRDWADVVAQVRRAREDDPFPDDQHQPPRDEQRVVGAHRVRLAERAGASG